MLTLLYRRIEQWPSLAWLAVCRRSNSTVEVLHGPGVELAPDWYSEAVWPGPFEEGDFDKVDLVFGSGGRVRSNSIFFVSSGSTLDRLHSLELQDCALVSNSLPCLLWFADGQIDLHYANYMQDFDSVVEGIDRYKPTLPTSVGSVRLTYFHNLLWDGKELRVIRKNCPRRDFGDFAKYKQFLDRSLEGIASNMLSAGRRRRLSMIGTMSSGYDSPTVAALAAPYGLKEVFSFKTARGGEDDSGTRIASALGLKLRLIDRYQWRAHPLPEVPFLVTDASCGEVPFVAAENRLSNKVLLTGFHGDKVWGMHDWPGAGDIVRGDNSGTSLCEYRLWAGFIQVPVPFFAATQAADIVAISNSPEMKPWSLSNSYDRPICRRILEEAGVPRDAFGTTKKAVCIIFWQRGDFMTAESGKECRRFLRAKGVKVRTLGSSIADVLAFASRALGRLALRVLPGNTARRTILNMRERASKLISLGRGSDPLARSKRMPLTTNDRLFQYVFPWAMDRAVRRYATSPQLGSLISPINLVGTDSAAKTTVPLVD